MRRDNGLGLAIFILFIMFGLTSLLLHLFGVEWEKASAISFFITIIIYNPLSGWFVNKIIEKREKEEEKRFISNYFKEHFQRDDDLIDHFFKDDDLKD